MNPAFFTNFVIRIILLLTYEKVWIMSVDMFSPFADGGIRLLDIQINQIRKSLDRYISEFRPGYGSCES